MDYWFDMDTKLCEECMKLTKEVDECNHCGSTLCDACKEEHENER